jgi:hypothetical protein
VVIDLLTGLGAIDGALAKRGIEHILTHSERYSLDNVIVPAARGLGGSFLSYRYAVIECMLARLRQRPVRRTGASASSTASATSASVLLALAPLATSAATSGMRARTASLRASSRS